MESVEELYEHKDFWSWSKYIPKENHYVDFDSNVVAAFFKIAGELFKCIRNLLAHFPFFDSWNEVYFNQNLINWFKEGMTIDKFFIKNESLGEIKYRFWNADKKIMTYITINLPGDYSTNNKIHVKNIINEKEGVLFSIILMKQVLDTQIVK